MNLIPVLTFVSWLAATIIGIFALMIASYQKDANNASGWTGLGVVLLLVSVIYAIVSVWCAAIPIWG